MSDPVVHDLELTTSALKAGPTALGIASPRWELSVGLGRVERGGPAFFGGVGAAWHHARAHRS